MTRRITTDIGETVGVVRRALSANDDALGRARALVDGSALVRLVGIGSSRHAAGYAATALGALRGVRTAVGDAPGDGVPVPAWREGDVAIVFSQSGSTPALVDAMAAAPVPVIAVVNDPASPLARRADVVLDCAAGPERVVAATKSVTAQLALGRAIASTIDAGVLDAALRDALAVPVEAAVTGRVPTAIVGGGFAGGWLADEVAVKLAEVAGVAATAEPLVEHLHGPIAAAATILALIDGDDANLAALGRAVVRVGTGDGATVPVPSTGDRSLDVIPKLVVAQRVVVAWAERLGQDPDAGRGLSKVTASR